MLVFSGKKKKKKKSIAPEKLYVCLQLFYFAFSPKTSAFPRETLCSLAKLMCSPEKLYVWLQNFCVPPRNFTFACQIFAFPRETFRSLAKLFSSPKKLFAFTCKNVEVGGKTKFQCFCECMQISSGECNNFACMTGWALWLWAACYVVSYHAHFNNEAILAAHPLVGIHCISSPPPPLSCLAASCLRVSPYFSLLPHSKGVLPQRNPFLSCVQIMEHHSSALVWQHTIAPALQESLKKCWAEKRSFLREKKKK